MEIKDRLGAIEAVLFACGEPIEGNRLAAVCDVETAILPSLINMLNDRYTDSGSGICIKKLADSYQMCTRAEYESQIRFALDTKRGAVLTNAAMEALTVIAYNQPVSKGFVESVRGVDSSNVINNLAEKGLIEEAGRLDVPGKPIVYKTTSVFLRSFGLNSLAELPPITGKDELKSPEDEDIS